MRKLGYGGMMFGKEERAALRKAINKNFWPLGEEGALMEQEAADFLGMKYGVLANSGSSAGLLALASLELPQGSEVIIPATTFPTIFNIILQLGLIPVVCDSKLGTYNLDVDDVEALITKDTKAIIAVHAVGNPVDMPRLMEVAKKHDIYVLEDNCDGWGSSIGERKVGSFGHISFTSFHAAHIVSMGQGGGVFTNDENLARNARMYRDWGRQADLEGRTNTKWKTLPKDYDSRFIYEKIGWNLSPLDLQAAMGRAQLRKTALIKKKRQTNFRYFYTHLVKHDQLIMPEWLDNADVCWFSFPLSVKDGLRGKLVAHLEARNIETRSMFSGNILAHPAYQGMKVRHGDLTDANKILTDSFWFTCHPSLKRHEREYIIKAFDDFFHA